MYADSEFVVDINGNILNAELNNFMANLDDYRDKYFQMALENDLQNIRYINMKVTLDDIKEKIQPYQSYEEIDDF